MSPLFVTTIVHLDGANFPTLDRVLAEIKSERWLSPRFVFRHASCSEPVRDAFFARIAGVPFTAHVLIEDKRGWPSERFRRRGWDTIGELTARLVCACPPAMISDQVILVDLSKEEARTVRQLGAAIKDGLRAMRIESMPRIKPCPDHRLQGAIVQLADMIAGAVSRAAGLEGSRVEAMKDRITLL